MKKTSVLMCLTLASLVSCSSYHPQKVASAEAPAAGPDRSVAQYYEPTPQPPTANCPIPRGYVQESLVMERISQDLNLAVRSPRPIEGFGSGQRNCQENVLSTAAAQQLLEQCNSRAFYIKRCTLSALPGATFGPLNSTTQTFEGTAHKRNCGNTPDNIACGRPLCEQDLQRNIAVLQTSCQNQYNARCDINPVGQVLHSFNDGRFRCSQAVTVTPYLQDGVSCRVMLEAKNASLDSNSGNGNRGGGRN